MIRATLFFAFVLSMTPLFAQDDPTILGDDAFFDAETPSDLAFDDPFATVFAEAFDNSSSSDSARTAWLNGFTVKLTQQVLFQTKTHDVSLRVPGGPLVTIPHEADVETNRLAANVRYQYAFAPGWLLQASGFARVSAPPEASYAAARLPPPGRTMTDDTLAPSRSRSGRVVSCRRCAASATT